MDLLFLGTSSGTPTRSRNVSGLALIEDVGKSWYLVDCGEGTQHQLLRCPLSLHDLHGVFITHVHGDHCFGLPGLLASAGMMGRRRKLDIIAPEGIEQWVLATLEMSQTHLPYELRFVSTESLNAWTGANVRVERFALSHRVPSYAYRFTEARPDPRLDLDKLRQDDIPAGPLWGQIARGRDVELDGRLLRSEDYLKFSREPRRIVIAGDNDAPELLVNACDQAHVLVHEATYTHATAERSQANHGHSTAASVAAFAASAGIAHLVLTHFSARYQNDTRRSPSIEDIRVEAASRYDGALFLAEDFQRFRLGKDGILKVV